MTTVQPVNPASPFDSIPAPDYHSLWQLDVPPAVKQVYTGAASAALDVFTENMGWFVMCFVLFIVLMIAQYAWSSHMNAPVFDAQAGWVKRNGKPIDK